MSEDLDLEQEDFFERLKADPFFSDVTVLLQRKGVTDSDVDEALSVLNEKAGKIGACAIVLLPSQSPEDPNVPGPRYQIIQTVQIIEQPLFNLGDTGTGKSAEQISQRVRQILHHFSNGYGGTYNFAGLEPIAADAGKISYGVKFSRAGGDAAIAKATLPTISTTPAVGPATGWDITLTCATLGAAIWYTTDGSYPSSANANAHLYGAPFNQATAATLRAAAEKSGMQQSNVRQLVLG